MEYKIIDSLSELQLTRELAADLENRGLIYRCAMPNCSGPYHWGFHVHDGHTWDEVEAIVQGHRNAPFDQELWDNSFVDIVVRVSAYDIDAALKAHERLRFNPKTFDWNGFRSRFENIVQEEFFRSTVRQAKPLDFVKD